MALRRIAHENNAHASPRSPDGVHNGASSLHSPSSSRVQHTPRTPRPSFGIHRSPADTPSLSSSIPFDWEAARSRAPPPYATPLKSRGRKSAATGNGTAQTRKGIVRKKGIIERIQNIPSAIAFEIALFPNNVPLPTPKVTARILGGFIHVLHFWILASHDNDDAWNSVGGVRNASWFDWSTPITILLVACSIYNSYSLILRTRNYKFHHRTDLLNSPHAKFVTTKLDLEPVEAPPLSKRVRANIWFAFSYAWRWLLGMQLPTRSQQSKEKTTRVQEIDMWEPSEMELELFSIYSPAHALLWLGMKSSSWILILLVMLLLSLQLNVLIHSYTLLLKDKQILAAETMREYNDIFVTPRINPIRHDVAVMTHQAEVVNVWEK